MAQLRRCVVTKKGTPINFPSWLSSNVHVTLRRLKKACQVAVSRTYSRLVDENCIEIIPNDEGGFV